MNDDIIWLNKPCSNIHTYHKYGAIDLSCNINKNQIYIYDMSHYFILNSEQLQKYELDVIKKIGVHILNIVENLLTNNNHNHVNEDWVTLTGSVQILELSTCCCVTIDTIKYNITTENFIGNIFVVLDSDYFEDKDYRLNLLRQLAYEINGLNIKEISNEL